MVKTLALIIVGAGRTIAAWPALRTALELIAVVLIAIAFGIWWGAPAVLLVIAVALLVKSTELDLRQTATRVRDGGG